MRCICLGYTYWSKFLLFTFFKLTYKIQVLIYRFITLYAISIILTMNILMVGLASLFSGTGVQLILFYFLLSNIIKRQLSPIFAPIRGQGDSPGM
jgi:hypothetical protein